MSASAGVVQRVSNSIHATKHGRFLKPLATPVTLFQWWHAAPTYIQQALSNGLRAASAWAGMLCRCHGNEKAAGLSIDTWAVSSEKLCVRKPQAAFLAEAAAAAARAGPGAPQQDQTDPPDPAAEPAQHSATVLEQPPGEVVTFDLDSQAGSRSDERGGGDEDAVGDEEGALDPADVAAAVAASASWSRVIRCMSIRSQRRFRSRAHNGT